MSAAMARDGGPVQLEQSDMRLASNQAKVAKEGFSHAAIEQRQQLIKKPRAEVQEAKKRGVWLPLHDKVKAAIRRHPAMVRENQTDGCLPCQNDTARNAQPRWRFKGTGAPPPPLAPPRPGMPPVPPDDRERTPSSETEGVLPGYVYIHIQLLSARFYNLDRYTEDRMRDKDFIPDLLTDEGPSTG